VKAPSSKFQISNSKAQVPTLGASLPWGFSPLRLGAWSLGLGA